MGGVRPKALHEYNVEETDRDEELLFERVARVGHFSHRTGRWNDQIPIRDIQPPGKNLVLKSLLELLGARIRWAAVLNDL